MKKSQIKRGDVVGVWQGYTDEPPTCNVVTSVSESGYVSMRGNQMEVRAKFVHADPEDAWTVYEKCMKTRMDGIAARADKEVSSLYDMLERAGKKFDRQLERLRK